MNLSSRTKESLDSLLISTLQGYYNFDHLLDDNGFIEKNYLINFAYNTEIVSHEEAYDLTKKIIIETLMDAAEDHNSKKNEARNRLAIYFGIAGFTGYAIGDSLLQTPILTISAGFMMGYGIFKESFTYLKQRQSAKIPEHIILELNEVSKQAWMNELEYIRPEMRKIIEENE